MPSQSVPELRHVAVGVLDVGVDARLLEGGLQQRPVVGLPPRRGRRVRQDHADAARALALAPATSTTDPDAVSSSPPPHAVRTKAQAAAAAAAFVFESWNMAVPFESRAVCCGARAVRRAHVLADGDFVVCGNISPSRRLCKRFRAVSRIGPATTARTLPGDVLAAAQPADPASSSDA
jgi:hypothetical protein